VLARTPNGPHRAGLSVLGRAYDLAVLRRFLPPLEFVARPKTLPQRTPAEIFFWHTWMMTMTMRDATTSKLKQVATIFATATRIFHIFPSCGGLQIPRIGRLSHNVCATCDVYSYCTQRFGKLAMRTRLAICLLYAVVNFFLTMQSQYDFVVLVTTTFSLFAFPTPRPATTIVL
jgi:hypothetical protein